MPPPLSRGDIPDVADVADVAPGGRRSPMLLDIANIAWLFRRVIDNFGDIPALHKRGCRWDVNLECVVTPECVWEGVPATHRGVLVSEMASEHSRWCEGTQGGVRVLKMTASTRVLRRHLEYQPATLGGSS